MPNVVRLSDDLVALAQDEAKAKHRSVVTQIEYWAELGRLIEKSPIAYLKVQEFLAGKLPLAELSGDEARLSTDAMLDEVIKASTEKNDTGLLHAPGKPYYEGIERYPCKVIRVMPDGSRQLGVFMGREFTVAKQLIDAQ